MNAVVIVTSIVALLVVFGLVYTYWRNQRFHKSMYAFADVNQLELTDRTGEFLDIKVEGSYRDRPISVHGYLKTGSYRRGNPGSGRSGSERISYEVPLDLQGFDTFEIRPDRLGVKDRGLHVGKPDIDEPYILEATPQHVGVAFFQHDEVVEALSALHRRAPDARVRFGHIELTRAGLPTNPRDLEAIVDAMVECADRLERVSSDFDPAVETPDADQTIEESDGDRADLLAQWQKAADALDLQFVSSFADGDAAIGGTVDGRVISVATRGPEKEFARRHAFVHVELPAAHLDDIVIRPEGLSADLFAMHTDPTPVGGEEFLVADPEIDENYQVIGEPFGNRAYLQQPETLDALKALLAEDMVLEIDDGRLIIEKQGLPLEADQLRTLIQRSAALGNTLHDRD